MEGSKLIVANVGDSRGVMCNSKGKAIPLSFDHKPQQVSRNVLTYVCYLNAFICSYMVACIKCCGLVSFSLSHCRIFSLLYRS